MTMTDSGITVEVLSRKDFAQLKEFCKVCATKGYRNNTDFGRLKLNKMVPPYGQYWVVKRDNKIICLSGCHEFPEIDDTIFLTGSPFNWMLWPFSRLYVLIYFESPFLRFSTLSLAALYLFFSISISGSIFSISLGFLSFPKATNVKWADAVCFTFPV